MENFKNYTLDNRSTRIRNTNFKNWWILQQLFAYLPFEEFFDTDKLIEYYSEFINGGIYQLEINIKDDIWIPVGMISWHPMVEDSHPVKFSVDKSKVAYISDSITYRGYQKKGIQSILFNYAIEKMKEKNFSLVYLRTSPESKMCTLANKLGFKLLPNTVQSVASMRVGGKIKIDERVFFFKEI